MCGISGIVNLKRTAKVLDGQTIYDIQKIMQIQRHRGPDDEGACGFSFQSCEMLEVQDPSELLSAEHLEGIFGFNRLSIKDLTIAGHQPMVSRLNGCTIAIVFNGEIYNDFELRQELAERGYVFRGHSDTEVILNMYLEFGLDRTLEMLNGMFAFALVDLKKQKLYLARDRFGIKPLYYSIYNSKIVFASELKSFIQVSDFQAEIDENAVNRRLMYARGAGEQTLLKNTQLLAAGTVLTAEFDGAVNVQKFFDLDSYNCREINKYKNLDEAIEEAESILSAAVARQMVSDVKVGCQLSGGIDSTLVTYYANKLASNNLNDAVSIVDSKGIIGEEEYIDHVGKQLSLKLHKFNISEDYFLKNYERMIWHNDAPVYQPYFICFMKLAEDAKKYVTVLLSGEGADEIAGGYSRFAGGYLYPFVKQMGASGTVKSYETYAHYAVMSGETIIDFLSLGCKNANELIQERIDVFNGFSGTNFTKHLKFEISQCLPEALLRQDKMTMASSIENRVPLLDNEVVDFVMRLPEDLLIRFVAQSPVNLSSNPFDWMQGKILFKEIVANKFGRDFAYRRKQIMALDKKAMVSSKSFKEYYKDLIYPNMKKRGLIDAKKVDCWMDNVDKISNKEFNSMWRAVSLETWCQLFIDGRHYI